MDCNNHIAENRSQRIEWIDEMKGVILLFICIGHISDVIFTPPIVKRFLEILTVIGVPTFFFLSGLLYKSKDVGFQIYVKRKTESLIIPYFLLSFLFTLFDPYTYNPQYLMDYLHYPKFMFLQSLGLNEFQQTSLEFFIGDICCTVIGISSRATLPLWFVYVLYFVAISYHGLTRKLKSENGMLIISVICFVFAIVTSSWWGGGYLKIVPCLMAFLFYGVGAWVAKYLYFFQRLSLLNIFMIGMACCSCFLTFFIDEVSFVNGMFPYDKPLLYLLYSFSGILSILLFVVFLNRISFWGHRLLKGILRIIARNSLVILAMHYWAIVVFAVYFKELIAICWQIYLALSFVVLICIGSIALFRTKLYMFIGGDKTRQSLQMCFSMKF